MQCRKDGTTEGRRESSIAPLFQSGAIIIKSRGPLRDISTGNLYDQMFLSIDFKCFPVHFATN